MKKRVLCVIIAALIVCVGVLSLSRMASAFGDYDGDYDFGGNDYDFGGNDYDFGGNDYDYDDDNDFDIGGFGFFGGGSDWGSGSGSGSSSSGSRSISFIGACVIVGIILLFFILRKRRGSGNVGSQGHTYAQPQVVTGAGATATDPNSLRPVSEYLTLDPGFSEAAFKEKLSNLFVQMQQCWQNKNLETLRPYFSDGFYAQMDRQLDPYRQNGRTKMIERVAVMDVQLSGFKQEEGRDVMIARLKTRFTTYTIDDKTGNMLSGSRSAEKFMDYEWELSRASGKTTQADGGVTVQNCPNCGAPVNINRTAKCEYCGSIITVDSYDWVLGGIKAISQRTVG